MIQSSKLKTTLVTAVFVLTTGAFVYPFFNAIKPPLPPAVEQPSTTGIPEFNEYASVVEKKKAFFNYLRPEIERQNKLIETERHWLMGLALLVERGKSITDSDRQRLQQLATRYRFKTNAWTAKSINALLVHVDVIPAPLVLVQAANESAWGTSRFARQGYNFFGLWCFSKGCGFVPQQRNDGANHEVAKFKSLSHAVSAYLTNLNRHYAYAELRKIRARLRRQQQPIAAEALVDGLIRYSERGQAYVDELLEMLRINRKYMT